MKVWLNGKLVDQQDANLSVLDHGTLYGDGVFEGIRIYNGRIFQCAAHVDRLFESAFKIRLPIEQTKQEIVDAMYETIAANEITDGYIRLVLTRGAGTLGLSPFKCAHPSTFIIADSIALYPQEMYDNGMAVIIAKTVRVSANMLDPCIKSLNYLNNICAKIEAIDAGVAEAIMLNVRGNVAECTGDNIFIVKDGQVITPDTDSGILVGVTRGLVISLARELGLTVTERSVTPDDLRSADECFLTGTAAEVISVTKIDDTTIGDGKVGEITKKLLAAFKAFTTSDRAEG
ncbi:MAG: branched-chain-amino-acid transaminase [Phycisphaerae bacterium]|jgi:branched-chain amino acid aminotransferase|nr:branched-chain-amino-acid transaminase [Phycisphaerae bacterium]MDP7289381.1 branched-chain-amino-acid transaminase [Phycisphaerae bacterium]